MRIAVFRSKPHDRQSLADANRRHGHVLEFFEPRLTRTTSFTGEAAERTAETTLANATAFERGEGEIHLVGPHDVRGG